VKRLLKLIIVITLLALAAPFLMETPIGQSALNLDKLEKFDAQQLLSRLFAPTGNTAEQTPSKKLNSSPLSESDVNRSVYRWQDEHGQWHYSDKAPNAQAAETVTLKPVNQISAPDTLQNTPTPLTSPGKAPEIKLPDNISLSNPDELIKQVQETQRIIQARQAEIDALMKSQQ